MAEKEPLGSKELLAPVPHAADYSVSGELWQRLEAEIQAVSERIDNGEELVPDDVGNIRKLKAQVEAYLMDFNKAMRDAQLKYKKMVDARLKEIHYDTIENFVAGKRLEQRNVQDSRIEYKMACLKEISNGLLLRTKRLKDTPMSKELLPAFMARFPKVQSGAKNNDITDWVPYFSVMSKVITVMDTFFCDPKYEDALLLPIHSGTIREFLAYAKDGREEHLANIQIKFKEDGPLIRMEKLRRKLTSKAEGIEQIKRVLDDMDNMGALDGIARQARTEQAWEEISLIVRLCNNQQ